MVDNRGGANGLLGSDIVAKATPDGYTLMATSFGFAVNPAITRNMPFPYRRNVPKRRNYRQPIELAFSIISPMTASCGILHPKEQLPLKIW